MFYTTHAYLMLYYYLKALGKTVVKRPLQIRHNPMVTVQLPLYNEQYVVERLLKSATQLQYPKDRLQIQVLDDSTDETTRILERLVANYRAQGFDIELLHRTNRRGFKAGALRDGLQKAKGEYVAIFDADFVIPDDFLQKTLPHFKKRVAAVQTRWGHLNDSYSALTRGQGIALDGHFFIEQQMRNLNGIFITFNGTGGIWRKRAIADAGGWIEDSLTEDLDLSYRAQLRGWRIEFLSDVVCRSEVPADINGFKAQQNRWAKGTIQTCKRLLFKVLRSKQRLVVKYEAIIHLTNHMVYPLLLGLSLLLLPLLLIKTHTARYQPYFLVASIFTIAVFSYPILYSLSQWALYPDWKKRLLYIPLIIGGCMALSITNTWAVLEGFLNRPSVFSRTPKFNLEKPTDRIRHKKYKQRLSISTFFELLMTLYLAATTVYAVVTLQLAILPFLILYTVGFGYISFVSIYQVLEDRLFVTEPVYGAEEAS
jgi:cellulose synthase/poly-beta-1,6-N-acetylglucosamine synthase-like glycosyltransferase